MSVRPPPTVVEQRLVRLFNAFRSPGRGTFRIRRMVVSESNKGSRLFCSICSRPWPQRLPYQGGRSGRWTYADWHLKQHVDTLGWDVAAMLVERDVWEQADPEKRGPEPCPAVWALAPSVSGAGRGEGAG